MPSVSEARRKLARQQAGDLSEASRLAVPIMQRGAYAALRATTRAYRNGEDVLAAFRAAWEDLRSGLIAAMVLTRLKAWARIRSRAKRELSLAIGTATVYGRALKALAARLDVGPGVLAAIEEQFSKQAITVLRTASLAAETRLQRTLIDLTERGAHVREGVAALSEAFKAEGISPVSTFQIEAIYRTQTQLAYAAGKLDVEASPEVGEILWGYQYVTVGDDRVRPEHEALDGVTLPKGDPFWSRAYPPNGWACRCQAVPLFEPEATVTAPDRIERDGRVIIPGPDKGFDYSPSALFRPLLAIT